MIADQATLGQAECEMFLQVHFFRSAFPLAAGREGTGMLVALISKRAALLRCSWLYRPYGWLLYSAEEILDY